MTPKTKRLAATGTSVGAIAALVVGSWAFASNLTAEPAPAATPAVVVTYTGTDENGLADEQEQAAAEAEAARIEAERVAAEQAAAEAEAARIEAERVAAEQAAAEQAQRQANTSPAQPSAPQAPAPPAPPAQPGGDQQAGECREYNDANECTAWYVP